MNGWIIQGVGTLGTILFASACVPLAWKTWKAGKSLGTPVETAWTSVAATLLFTIYLALIVGLQFPTVLSGIEFVSWSVVLWYTHWPRDLFSRVLDALDSFDWSVVHRDAKNFGSPVNDYGLTHEDDCPMRSGGYHASRCQCYLSVFERICTLREGHDGPCNGYPKRGCTVYIDDHGPLHNQKVRLL